MQDTEFHQTVEGLARRWRGGQPIIRQAASEIPPDTPASPAAPAAPVADEAGDAGADADAVETSEKADEGVLDGKLGHAFNELISTAATGTVGYAAPFPPGIFDPPPVSRLDRHEELEKVLTDGGLIRHNPLGEPLGESLDGGMEAGETH